MLCTSFSEFESCKVESYYTKCTVHSPNEHGTACGKSMNINRPDQQTVIKRMTWWILQGPSFETQTKQHNNYYNPYLLTHILYHLVSTGAGIIIVNKFMNHSPGPWPWPRIPHDTETWRNRRATSSSSCYPSVGLRLFKSGVTCSKN